jgi:hypothetical protein
MGSKFLPAENFYVIFLSGLALLAGSAGVASGSGPSVEHPIDYIEARLRGPIEIVEAVQARPRIEGDRSARVVLAGQGDLGNLNTHWKPVAPPGRGYNNEPRYILAAYEFQKLFLDECEFVVPPVVLRALSLEEHARLRGDAAPTLRGTSSVLFLLSYWLNNVTNRDPWDPARFASDERYARHWGNLNILTHLIDHKDANLGNLLISEYPDDPRVFSVDNDVAFASEESDRGITWSRLQVDRLPADTLDRLRTLTLEQLERQLGVLAEFRVVNGVLIAVDEPGGNLSSRTGLRTSGDRVQFGLTVNEIRTLHRRIGSLVAQLERGRIQAVAATPTNRGATCGGSGGE